MRYPMVMAALAAAVACGGAPVVPPSGELVDTPTADVRATVAVDAVRPGATISVTFENSGPETYIVAACGRRVDRLVDGEWQATPVDNAPHLTRAEFTSLRWLAGRWIGSGGGYQAFYEEYRVLNDSTIEQVEHPDSTWANPGRRSVIEWRNGRALKSRNGRVESFIARISGDTAQFSFAARSGGFTWIRVSTDVWHAHVGQGDRAATYVMRRASR
jgi:hypothetical protein